MFMGLWAPADYNGEQVLNNFMLTAREPGSPDSPWDGKFGDPSLCGPDGWPLDDFGVCIVTYGTNETGHLAGTHTLIFDGPGNVTVAAVASNVSFGAPKSVMRVAGVVETTIPITIDANATQIFLKFLNTQGKVRNVRLIRDGASVTNPWNPKALALLQNFQGFRFMDLQGTNNQGDIEWKDRRKPGDAAGQRKLPKSIDPIERSYFRGVPLEALIGLCVTSKKEGWFCVPHMASDDYIRQMAALFAKLWTHGKKLYLQYSNEAWNGDFAVLGYLEAKFNKDYYAIMRYIADQTLKIGDAFKAAGVPNVVPVLAGQLANPDWVKQGMIHLAQANPSRKMSDMIAGIAGAPYINPPADDTTFVGITDAFAAHHAIAQANGIDFFLYEYGIEQSLLPSIRDDAAVVPIIQRMLKAWNDSCPPGSSKTACYYVLGGGGYGLCPFPDSPTQGMKALIQSLMPPPSPAVLAIADCDISIQVRGGKITSTKITPPTGANQ
jgi:hypothetical protein